MAGNVQIDARGANDMFAVLQKKTGMTYRDVVRGVADEILLSTAIRTRKARPDSVEEGVEKILRQPFVTSKGARIGKTKKYGGRIWYCGPGWNPQVNWVLVRETSPFGPIQKTGIEVAGRIAGRPIKITGRLMSEINSAITEANQVYRRELAYRNDMIGLGQATWLEIMRNLRMPIKARKALAKAMGLRVPMAAKSALKGYESKQGVAEFNVYIQNNSSAALNSHAKGLSAFRQSFNGHIKRFKKKTGEDLEKYARQFAKRNGFIIK